jgi:type IV secretory pathway VirJ component
MPNVRRVVLPGGHPLRGDDAALAAAILPAIEGGHPIRSETR